MEKASIGVKNPDDRILREEKDIHALRDDVNVLFETGAQNSEKIDETRKDTARLRENVKDIEERSNEYGRLLRAIRKESEDRETEVMDKRLERVETRLNTPSSYSPIAKELIALGNQREERNRELRAICITDITRIVLEFMAAILILLMLAGCTLNLEGQRIDPRRIRNSVWICSPTIMDDMEVLKIIFSEDGDDGSVIFYSRGMERERKFRRKGNEMWFTSPEGKWDFITDYDKSLTVDWGPADTDFIRFRDPR